MRTGGTPISGNLRSLFSQSSNFHQTDASFLTLHDLPGFKVPATSILRAQWRSWVCALWTTTHREHLVRKSLKLGFPQIRGTQVAGWFISWKILMDDWGVPPFQWAYTSHLGSTKGFELFSHRGRCSRGWIIGHLNIYPCFLPTSMQLEILCI